jgi:hypothetical protein
MIYIYNIIYYYYCDILVIYCYSLYIYIIISHLIFIFLLFLIIIHTIYILFKNFFLKIDFKSGIKLNDKYQVTILYLYCEIVV